MIRRAGTALANTTGQVVGGVASNTLDIFGHISGFLAFNVGKKNGQRLINLFANNFFGKNYKSDPIKERNHIPWYYQMLLRTLNGSRETLRLIREDDDRDDHIHGTDMIGTARRVRAAVKWPIQMLAIGMVVVGVPFVAAPGTIAMINAMYLAAPAATIAGGLLIAGTVGSMVPYVMHKSGGITKNLKKAAVKTGRFCKDLARMALMIKRNELPEEDELPEGMWADIKEAFNKSLKEEIKVENYADYVRTPERKHTSLLSKRARHFDMWRYTKVTLAECWRDIVKVSTTPIPVAKAVEDSAAKGDKPFNGPDDRQPPGPDDHQPPGPM